MGRELICTCDKCFVTITNKRDENYVTVNDKEDILCNRCYNNLLSFFNSKWMMVENYVPPEIPHCEIIRRY